MNKPRYKKTIEKLITELLFESHEQSLQALIQGKNLREDRERIRGLILTLLHQNGNNLPHTTFGYQLLHNLMECVNIYVVLSLVYDELERKANDPETL